jgi:hypothetical protein
MGSCCSSSQPEVLSAEEREARREKARAAAEERSSSDKQNFRNKDVKPGVKRNSSEKASDTPPGEMPLSNPRAWD